MYENIKAVSIKHIDKIKEVIDSCGLFPSEYLDEMTNDYFNNVNTQDIWFTHIENEKPTAIGYCAPEKFAEGTYNLLAIGVSKESQGKGIATEMMKYIELLLKQKNGRVLIVETSSDDAQIAARNFYNKIGYTQKGIISDFWNEGEDKIIYWKKL